MVRRVARLERRPVVRAVMLAATRAADGWGLAVVVPAALVVGGRPRGGAAGVSGAVSAVLIALRVHVVKSVVRRRRPVDVELLRPIGAYGGHAFPSGHSAQAFSVLVVAFVTDWRFGLALLPACLLVPLSRVVFGVHFPTDVAAGAALGAGVAWLTTKGLTAAGLVAWTAG